MKTLIYLAVALCFTMTSCKKTNGKGKTLPSSFEFEIIGKDGNNIIHSIKDSLVVTYIMNGVTETSRLRPAILFF